MCDGVVFLVCKYHPATTPKVDVPQYGFRFFSA